MYHYPLYPFWALGSRGEYYLVNSPSAPQWRDAVLVVEKGGKNPPLKPHISKEATQETRSRNANDMNVHVHILRIDFYLSIHHNVRTHTQLLSIRVQPKAHRAAQAYKRSCNSNSGSVDDIVLNVRYLPAYLKVSTSMFAGQDWDDHEFEF